jgi:hypothetical protein
MFVTASPLGHGAVPARRGDGRPPGAVMSVTPVANRPSARRNARSPTAGAGAGSPGMG